MSRKTDRLVALFPDAYAATDSSSLLYKLLDSFGAELLETERSIKDLLKSHWVDYANGRALDGLGAIYNVTRRRLPGGGEEPDEAFRLRLKSIVSLFTGGGTPRAVVGAIRSALGLPFNLEVLDVPDQVKQDLEKLVTLIEFSPTGERLVDEILSAADAGELVLDVTTESVQAGDPTLAWTFTKSRGRLLRIERLDTNTGIEAIDPNNALVVPQGQTLFLSRKSDGLVQAFLDGVEVSDRFQAIGGGPPLLPEVAGFNHQWQFSAGKAAQFDLSRFDFDTLDLPWFRVEMIWERFKPLTFDVYIPFFLKQAVDDIKARYGLDRDIFVYEGLEIGVIQEVLDRTRAAGVQGSIHFSLYFYSNQTQEEAFVMDIDHHVVEDAGAAEELTTASGAQLAETHDVVTSLALGGVHDVSTFDSGFAFI